MILEIYNDFITKRAPTFFIKQTCNIFVSLQYMMAIHFFSICGWCGNIISSHHQLESSLR